MSDDELAFFRAAAADPHDDVVRMAYSDWLEEQGTECRIIQAQFVRMQLERAKLPVGSEEWQHKMYEEDWLRKQHGRKWNGPHHRHLHQCGLKEKVDARRGAIRSWTYTRGMVSGVTVTMDTLIQQPQLVFDRGPVRMLTIPNWRPYPLQHARKGTFPEQLSRLLVVQSEYAVPVHTDFFQALRDAGVLILDVRTRVQNNSDIARFRQLIQSKQLPPMVITTQSHNGGCSPVVIDPAHMWHSVKAEYQNLVGKSYNDVAHQ